VVIDLGDFEECRSELLKVCHPASVLFVAAFKMLVAMVKLSSIGLA